MRFRRAQQTLSLRTAAGRKHPEGRRFRVSRAQPPALRSHAASVTRSPPGGVGPPAVPAVAQMSRVLTRRPLPSPHSAGRRTVVSYPGPLRLRQLLARPSFRVTRPCRLRAERVGCRGGGPVLEWSDVTAHAQGLCAQSGEVPAVQRPVSHHALVCARSTSRGPGRGPRGRPRGLAVPVWLVPAPCAVRKGVTAQPAPDRAVVAASRAQGPGRGRSRPGASELLTPDSVPPASSERPGTSGHSYWTNRGRPPPAFSGLLFTFSGFAALPSFSSCFYDQVFTRVFPTLKANEPLLKGWK